MSRRKQRKQQQQLQLYQCQQESPPATVAVVTTAIATASMPGRNLLPCLETAVRIRIMDYELRGGPCDTDFHRVSGLVDDLASRCDEVLCRSSKKGDSAKAFNKLVDALSVMAFVPGGCKVFGIHFVGCHRDNIK